MLSIAFQATTWAKHLADDYEGQIKVCCSTLPVQCCAKVYFSMVQYQQTSSWKQVEPTYASRLVE
jgi:hypothetical protein